MKHIAEQADILAGKMQMVSDSLADYNPGLCKDKIPLQTISYDLACIGKEITWLYVAIEKKVKDGKIMQDS